MNKSKGKQKTRQNKEKTRKTQGNSKSTVILRLGNVQGFGGKELVLANEIFL